MPQPLLQYEMAVIGRRAVEQALASVERRAARINRLAAGGRAVGARAGVAEAQRVAARTVADPAERLAHQKRKREIRQEGQLRRQLAKETARAELREARVTHRQRLSNIRREEREKTTSIRRAAAQEQASLRRAARAVIRDQDRFQRQRLAERRALIGGAVGRAGSATAGVGRAAIGALGLGGGLMFASAMRHRILTTKAAAQLAVKAYGTPGETRSKEQIQGAVMRTAEAEGVRTGFGAEGIIQGLGGVVAKTGSLAAAEQIIGRLADIADATASDVGEVGDVAGILIQSMMAKGVAMPEALAQTTTALEAFAQQAKEGSIEFQQLTGIGAKIVAPSARFGGELGKTIAMLGGIAQQAIAGGAASAEEAGTAVMRFADDVVKNSKRFQKLGIDIWADKPGGKLATPERIITETIKQTGGDIRKVTELFGIRGFKAVEPFVQRFQKVSAAAGGGKAGTAAGLEELRNVFAQIEQTTMAQAEIRRSAAFRRQNIDKQIAIAMEKFRIEIGTKLLPTVTKLIPKLSEMVPAIATVIQRLVEMASWAMDNPFKGLGLLFGGFLVKELAAAKIGQIFARALTAQMAPGAVAQAGAATPAAVVGGAAKRRFLSTGVSPATAIAGLATAIGAGFAYEAIDADIKGRAEAGRSAVAQDIVESETLRKAHKEFQRTGTLSPDTAKALRQLQANLDVRSERVLEGTPSWLGAAWGELAGGRGFGYRARRAEETKRVQEIEFMRHDTAKLLATEDKPRDIAAMTGEGMGRTGVAASLAAITAPVKAERQETAAEKMQDSANKQVEAVDSFGVATRTFQSAVQRFAEIKLNTGDQPSPTGA